MRRRLLPAALLALAACAASAPPAASPPAAPERPAPADTVRTAVFAPEDASRAFGLTDADRAAVSLAAVRAGVRCERTSLWTRCEGRHDAPSAGACRQAALLAALWARDAGAAPGNRDAVVVDLACGGRMVHALAAFRRGGRTDLSLREVDAATRRQAWERSVVFLPR